MPAVFGFGSDRRQNACRFTGLDNANDFIGFRLSEIGIDELIPPAFWSLQDWCFPFLRTILDPVVKLRCDVAQDIPANRIEVAIFAEEADHSLLLLKWLNDSVQQDSIETAVMESDVILVMLVESVHAISFQ